MFGFQYLISISYTNKLKMIFGVNWAVWSQTLPVKLLRKFYSLTQAETTMTTNSVCKREAAGLWQRQLRSVIKADLVGVLQNRILP